jgi:enamine deaminase RidA (YjgF/YER057c/UK114 family)
VSLVTKLKSWVFVSGTSPGRPDAKAVKENQIPNEILQTIETFK